nr:uncharacterized protein LOC122273343 [Parasteatoda tepidariorum]
MPGAMSPLGAEFISKFFMAGLSKQAYEKGQVDPFAKSIYYPSLIKTFYYQAVMGIPEWICRHGHDTIFSKGLSISIFGRLLDEPELNEVAKERVPDLPKATFLSDLKFIKVALNLLKLSKIFFIKMQRVKSHTGKKTFYAFCKNLF